MTSILRNWFKEISSLQGHNDSPAEEFLHFRAGDIRQEGASKAVMEIEVPERYTHMNINSRGAQQSDHAIV